MSNLYISALSSEHRLYAFSRENSVEVFQSYMPNYVPYIDPVHFNITGPAARDVLQTTGPWRLPIMQISWNFIGSIDIDQLPGLGPAGVINPVVRNYFS